MNVLRVLLSFVIVGIFDCANAIPIFQDSSVAQALESAMAALSEGSYGTALNILRSARSSRAMEHAVLPTEVDNLRHFATKRRLMEIASQIVLAYHQANVEQTLSLANEAILIAKEDGVSVPKNILRIKSMTERHYFEPVFYGTPPHRITRKIIA